jgi:hypothetical protein
MDCGVWHASGVFQFGTQMWFWVLMNKRGFGVWVCVMGFKVMVHEWGLGECLVLGFWQTNGVLRFGGVWWVLRLWRNE